MKRDIFQNTITDLLLSLSQFIKVPGKQWEKGYIREGRGKLLEDVLQLSKIDKEFRGFLNDRTKL